MADTDSYIKPQRLASQIPQNQTDPNRVYTHFIYKVAILAIFLVVVPLFSSQAPEFINQTLRNRSWEVVQLLFVGIAVSYGLFSKRNDEAEKEHGSKLDNAHSIVSGFLQVSSVFDDETDFPSGSDDKKLQTWNSQYYREEPVLVVAQENSVLEEQRGASSRVDEKPLLLPVRSLKSRVSESDVSSNSASKRFSNNQNKPRNGEYEFRSLSPLDLEEEAEENIVLRSPIPWRSRSEKMEMREEMKFPPPSPEELEFHRFKSRSFRSRSSRSSRPNSTSPSPSKLSPSPSLSYPSFSMESQAKNVEELGRKKNYYQFPPPPPPPPPPRYVHKPPPVKSNSNPILSNSEIYSVKEVKRSTRSLPKDLSGSESRASSVIGKSVRTTRSESISGYVNSRELDEVEKNGKSERRSVISNPGLGDYQKEETPELVENMVSETEEDQSENEGDVFEERSNYEEAGLNSVGDGGPDVNKKADEFIAKFREQIRLQRIESIKKSTGYIARSSAR